MALDWLTTALAIYGLPNVSIDVNAEPIWFAGTGMFVK
jgi:hypothetical protein